MIYLSSDFHLGHANILHYCNRPFHCLDKMNETIIRNTNERCKSTDTLFHLGDFCFKNSSGGKDGEGSIIKASTWERVFNCKIIFIEGNHDVNNGCKTPIRSMLLHLCGQDFWAVHNPSHINWSYKINLVGHVHDKWKFMLFERKEKIVGCINVGVDQWEFYPKTIDEMLTLYNRWLKTDPRPIKI